MREERGGGGRAGEVKEGETGRRETIEVRQEKRARGGGRRGDRGGRGTRDFWRELRPWNVIRWLVQSRPSFCSRSGALENLLLTPGETLVDSKAVVGPLASLVVAGPPEVGDAAAGALVAAVRGDFERAKILESGAVVPAITSMLRDRRQTAGVFSAMSLLESLATTEEGAAAVMQAGAAVYLAQLLGRDDEEDWEVGAPAPHPPALDAGQIAVGRSWESGERWRGGRVFLPGYSPSPSQQTDELIPSEVQEAAAATLCNLATFPRYRAAILSACPAANLIRVICTGEEAAAQAAANALGNLVLCEEGRAAVAEAGGEEALKRLLDDGDSLPPELRETAEGIVGATQRWSAGGARRLLKPPSPRSRLLLVCLNPLAPPPCPFPAHQRALMPCRTRTQRAPTPQPPRGKRARMFRQDPLRSPAEAQPRPTGTFLTSSRCGEAQRTRGDSPLPPPRPFVPPSKRI